MFTFVSKSFCPSAFKRHFLSPIGNKKAHRPCINFSSTFKRSVYRFLYPLFQNHFLLVRLIRRIPQPWGKYQQNGKQTYCRLPPQSFRITLKDTPSHISMKSWGFYLSKIFLEFFSNMHIPPPPPCPSQVEENYSFLLNSVFLESIFSQQKVNYGAQRMTKIKRARILSQVLINSTIFATFIFLVSVFCVIIWIQSCWSKKVP